MILFRGKEFILRNVKKYDADGKRYFNMAMGMDLNELVQTVS